MTRQEARDHINNNPDNYLSKAKKGGYICTVCGNGSGADATGISRDKKDKRGTHFKCFKCDAYGDTLHFLKAQLQTDNETEVFNFIGLDIDGGQAGQSKPAPAPDKIKASPEADAEPEQLTDYTDYFLKAADELQRSREAIEYLQKRGISPETAERYFIGYDAAWRSPAAVRSGNKPPADKRIIIPTDKYSYTARTINDAKTKPQFKFMKEGAAGIFNLKALYDTKPIYICEGAFDALSICEAGGTAAAIGSTSGADLFIKTIDNNPATAPIILSLDNDEAGQTAQAKIKAELDKRSIAYYEHNTAGSYKDPNEHLQADREAFTQLIKDNPAERERREYMSRTAAADVPEMIRHIKQSALTPAISTGFSNIDKAFDGGIYPGLIVIGGLTSAGKTTLVLQIADSMAAAGHDVLFYSMEMSKYELMSKSISRLTYELCEGDTRHAKTARYITAGSKWETFTDREAELIDAAFKHYESGAGRHMRIIESVADTGTEQIRADVEKHINITGNKPIVFIDYLQTLKPPSDRLIDKQVTDRNILELKRISRDNGIAIIAISSINRESYIQPITLTSFKESGMIEFSSDILIGLQYTGMDELTGADSGKGKKTDRIKVKAWGEASIRDVQLEVLKNRNGKRGQKLYYKYNSLFNHFKETESREVSNSVFGVDDIDELDDYI